jgi:hypothetical protein
MQTQLACALGLRHLFGVEEELLGKCTGGTCTVFNRYPGISKYYTIEEEGRRGGGWMKRGGENSLSGTH